MLRKQHKQQIKIIKITLHSEEHLFPAQAPSVNIHWRRFQLCKALDDFAVLINLSPFKLGSRAFTSKKSSPSHLPPRCTRVFINYVTVRRYNGHYHIHIWMFGATCTPWVHLKPLYSIHTKWCLKPLYTHVQTERAILNYYPLKVFPVDEILKYELDTHCLAWFWKCAHI